MKITKTVRYHFKLTEETLEKDIARFIEEARNGDYSWDYKFGMEGLKIIKQYFKIIQEKFDKEKYEECKNCYHLLIVFVFNSSIGKDASLGYEDLLSRTKLNWEKILENYFLSIIKKCGTEELVDKIIEYAIARSEYWFDSDVGTLVKELDEQRLKNIEQVILSKIQTIKKKDDKQSVIYFLLEIIRKQKDKENYNRLLDKISNLFDKEEIDYLKKEFYEDEP